MELNRGLVFATRAPNRPKGEGWCSCTYPANTVLEIRMKTGEVLYKRPLCDECANALLFELSNRKSYDPEHRTKWCFLPNGGLSCCTAEFKDVQYERVCPGMEGEDCCATCVRRK